MTRLFVGMGRRFRIWEPSSFEKYETKAREYMKNYREVPRPHPEMFDTQGNLIPDDIVAFRFENYDNENSEEDDYQI